MGQGTAITGHYDLDLVLYSSSKFGWTVLKCQHIIIDLTLPVINFHEADENGYDDYLDKIESYLERKLSPFYTFLSKTDVAIEFSYRLPEGGYLKVDLLLSPHWSSREAYFHDLAAINNRLR